MDFPISFDDMAARFTNRVATAAGWKHNYPGAAYSTRIKSAIHHLRSAIAEAELHSEIGGAMAMEAAEEKPIEPGHLVCLRSGGPTMTVAAILPKGDVHAVRYVPEDDRLEPIILPAAAFCPVPSTKKEGT